MKNQDRSHAGQSGYDCFIQLACYILVRCSVVVHENRKVIRAVRIFSPDDADEGEDESFQPTFMRAHGFDRICETT